MRLNPLAFNRLISGNLAQNVRWRAASICPCADQFSGAPAQSCQRCGGKGRVWADPVACKVGITNQAVKVRPTMQFNWEAGDAILTVDESSPAYAAGQFDRFTMLNSTDRGSLALVRGDPAERIHAEVLEWGRIYWYTGPNGTGDIVEATAQPTVGASGVLSWPASGGPPVGKTYSISFERYTEYFIYLDLPSDRGEHGGARLPKKMQARRFDLFGR